MVITFYFLSIGVRYWMLGTGGNFAQKETILPRRRYAPRRITDTVARRILNEIPIREFRVKG